MSSIKLIDSRDGLMELVDELLQDTAVALDTEFHGEGRYWPELFLVQLAGSRGPVAVDPVAIQDLTPLRELVQAEKPVKIIHSSRNDIEILRHHLDVEFRSVFDTQLAAAFLGFEQQTALYKLIGAFCGKNPQKGHTLTDWSTRPLSTQQIEYALNDVRYLPEIYRREHEQLREKGKLAWYDEEAEVLTDPAIYGAPMEKLFRKVRSAGKIRKDKLPLLWELVNWRESTAARLNKPRNYIAKDHVLGAISSMAPGNLRDLATLRGVSAGFVSNWGEELLSVVRKARKSTRRDFPSVPRYHSRPGISARRDILRIFLKQESQRLGIAPGLLFSSDLPGVLAEKPPSSEEELKNIPELSGWRGEALGNDLISLLKGKLALRLKPGGKQELQFVEV